MNNLNIENNILLSLPNEIHIEYLSYLPEKDISKLPGVCKKLSELVETIWKDKMIAQIERELGLQFYAKFKTWRLAHLKFAQMSKEGQVLSPTEMIVNSERRIGNFENGMLSGIGKIILSNKCELKGVFNNGILCEGKLTIPYYGTEEGKFIGDKNKHLLLHGLGKKTFNGSIYRGQIHKGQFKNGFLIEGEKIYPNGLIEKGIFKRNKIYQGEIIYADGRILEVRKPCIIM